MQHVQLLRRLAGWGVDLVGAHCTNSLQVDSTLALHR